MTKTSSSINSVMQDCNRDNLESENIVFCAKKAKSV